MLDEHGIARPDLGDLSCGQRIPKAGIPLEVRVREVDDAHRLAAGRRVQRTRIQIEDLFRREHRETPLADGAAGQVVRGIVVTRRCRAIADPDAREWLETMPAESNVVVLAKAGRGTRRSSVEAMYHVGGRSLSRCAWISVSTSSRRARPLAKFSAVKSSL